MINVFEVLWFGESGLVRDLVSAVEIATKAVDVALKLLGTLVCLFCLAAGTCKLGFFGFDAEDVACVVFDQLGVLVL